MFEGHSNFNIPS